MGGIESDLAVRRDLSTDSGRLNGARRRGNLWTILAAVIGVGIGLSASVFAGKFARKGGSQASGAVASASAEPTMSVEEATRLHKREHDESIVRHAAEPVDAAWASKTSEALGSELNVIAKERSFRVVDVDCRDTSCVGTLEWPSYDVAFREWSSVLNHPYSIRCGVEVFLDTPADHALAYRTGVVFQCGKSKT